MSLNPRQCTFNQTAALQIGEILREAVERDNELRHGSHAQLVTIKAGSYVFTRCSEVSCIWLLSSGSAAVEFAVIADLIPSGRPARDSEVFGLTEFLAGFNHTSTLRAITTCSFYQIGCDDLMSSLVGDVNFRSMLISELADVYLRAVHSFHQ